MLEFTTAEEDSLEAFLSVSASSPYQTELREYADSLILQRCTKPGWCVLGLGAGQPVARAALWAPTGQDVPTDTVLIETDWSTEDLSTGEALLTRMHELAGSLGAEGLAHSVDSPPTSPQYQDNEEARIHLLLSSGYKLLRDGLRWRYTPADAPRADEGQTLVFRSLPDVGEDAFVEAMASTYEGTRDSWLTRNIEEHGLLEAARADFVDYQGFEYRPEWWELAYAEEGTLAGVIMAGRNPSTAVIAYVGVVPEHRGRGLARQLVRRGTDLLVRSGADEIRADCDRDNVGMVKGFERAGYEQFARRRTYDRALAA